MDSIIEFHLDFFLFSLNAINRYSLSFAMENFFPKNFPIRIWTQKRIILIASSSSSLNHYKWFVCSLVRGSNFFSIICTNKNEKVCNWFLNYCQGKTSPTTYNFFLFSFPFFFSRWINISMDDFYQSKQQQPWCENNNKKNSFQLFWFCHIFFLFKFFHSLLSI